MTKKVVVVTGAAGQIGYSLLPLLASGQVFGPNISIELRLLEIPSALNALRGIEMELQDCAFSQLDEIVCTDNPIKAFKDATVAFLIGGYPRKKGQLRKDLIMKNTNIFVGMGQAIEAVASAEIRVLVIANPANTNCLTALRQCSRIPQKNFCAMTQLDLNRARSFVARKLGTAVSNVKNVIIWGNHSSTQVPDASTDGYILEDGERRPLIIDDSEFSETIRMRGKSIIEARGLSSAMSAARAAADCMRIWLVTGTPSGETTSMAVLNTDNAYGIENGIVVSMPCECSGDGNWNIKKGLRLSESTKALIKISESELLSERKATDEIIGKK